MDLMGLRHHLMLFQQKLFSITSFKGLWSGLSLSIEWNSIRLGGPMHGIVTKTVHKLCQGVLEVQGVGG